MLDSLKDPKITFAIKIFLVASVNQTMNPAIIYIKATGMLWYLSGSGNGARLLSTNGGRLFICKNAV